MRAAMTTGRSVITQSAAGATLVLALTITRSAFAQDSRDLGAAAPEVSATEGLEARTPYWSAGKKRFFVAGAFDLGGIFARNELDLGYGKPYYAWGGIEAWSRLTTGGVTFYAGPRLSIPHFTLRAGLRSFDSVDTHFLAPRHSYQRIQLDLTTLPLEHYGALDAEALAYAGLGPGTVSLLTTVHGFIGIDNGFYIYDDAYHVIVNPHWMWTVRAAYLATIGKLDDMGVGGAVELINVPNRNMTTVRVGPVISVSLTHHLQATGAAFLAVASRDHLGLAGADLGQIGVRYRWASGDLWPEFP